MHNVCVVFILREQGCLMLAFHLMNGSHMSAHTNDSLWFGCTCSLDWSQLHRHISNRLKWKQML